MLPLGYTHLSDSPTIVLSPHQHQFDPISSQAAHTFCRNQHIKPIMPKKPWDSAAKAVLVEGNQAQKRTRNQAEADTDVPNDPQSLSTPTPQVSPDPAQGAGILPTNPLIGSSREAQSQTGQPVPQEEDKTDFENKMEEALSGTTQLGTSRASEQPGSSPKRQRQLEGSINTPAAQAPFEPFGASKFTSAFKEDFDHDPWVEKLGLGWTSTDGDVHEKRCWQSFKQIVSHRFALSHVKFLAKNRNQDLCVAASERGWLFFPGTFDRCWRIAETEEAALQRMREGPVNVDNCIELVKIHDPTSPSRSSILTKRVAGTAHLSSSPDGWEAVAHMSRLDGVHGSSSFDRAESSPGASASSNLSAPNDVSDGHNEKSDFADQMEVD